MHGEKYTNTVTSLATNAEMSAHETTPGQDFSNSVLTLSIMLYPLRLRFGIENFSDWLFGESNRTDPSQP